MTQKHTPGPWFALRNSAYWQVNPENGGEGGIPHQIGDVCSSAPGDPDGGLQEANARLIAAAPTMLDALWSVLPKLSHGSPEWQIVHDAIDKASS